MRPIPKRALDFVSEHEGCKLESYQDSGSTWTIGFGSTRGVHAGMRITRPEALKRLQSDLSDARAKLYGVVKMDVIEELTSCQYAALISFCFNLGAKPEWTIWKLLNARDFDGVPAQMMRFVRVGQTKVQGLVNRRAAEVKLWSENEPGSVDAEHSSGYTRVEATPPTPEPVKPMVQSKTVWTGVGQIVGSISAGALAVQQTIAPHAASAAFLGKAVAALGILMAVSGVLLLAIKTLEKREAKR